jgi:cell division protein FtsW
VSTLTLSMLRARLPVELDPWLLNVSLALLVLGLVMVASSSVAVAEKLTGAPLYFFWRQLVYVGMGLMLGSLMLLVPLSMWERSGFLLLSAAMLLLILVLIPGIGKEVNSARRWIDLQFFNLQASEPARLGIVIYITGYVVRRQIELQHHAAGLFKPLLVLGAAAGLLLLEPDFGAAVILAGVGFLVLFLGGARLIYLISLALLAVGAFAMLAVAQPYRLRRLLGFSDPWADVESSGWQLSQALIAIGRGEWTGVGLGNSLQKLLYLPEQHTDFIFAVYAEEFGLIGVVVLLTLYGVLVWRGLRIAAVAEAQDARFRAYLTYALTFWIGFQVLVNLAVNMGLAPTKGLTLPMMSYGGSSLLTVCAMLGLILRADWENRAAERGNPVERRSSVRKEASCAS